MPSKLTFRRGRDRRGTATVELALCLPFFIAATLYCVEVAQAYHGQMVVDAAAWRGAHAAATKRFTPQTYPQWEEFVREQIAQEMATIDRFDPAQLDVTLETIHAEERITVAVGVTYVRRAMIPLPLTGGQTHHARQLTIRQYR